MEPMWADLGLEEMPSEVSSSGTSSGECSELEGGWDSEIDAMSCGSGDSDTASGSSGRTRTRASRGGRSVVRK